MDKKRFLFSRISVFGRDDTRSGGFRLLGRAQGLGAKQPVISSEARNLNAGDLSLEMTRRNVRDDRQERSR